MSKKKEKVQEVIELDERGHPLVVRVQRKDFKSLREDFSHDWLAPPEEVRPKVLSENPLPDHTIRFLQQQAQMLQLPISVLTVIPTKNGPQVYITQRGIQLLLQLDPDPIKEWRAEIIQYPTSENPLAIARGILRIGDAVYENFAARYVPIPTRYQDYRQMARKPDDLLTALATKALRRVGVLRVPPLLPLFEEAMEFRQNLLSAMREPAANALPVTGPTNGSLVDLLNEMADFGLSQEDALALLGMADVGQLAANLERAWETWNKEKAILEEQLRKKQNA